MSPNQGVWPPGGSPPEIPADVRESLRQIERKIDRLFYLAEYVEEHERLLCGVNGEPGLRIRVDRVEQTLKSHRNYLSILAAGIVAVFVDLLQKALRLS